MLSWKNLPKTNTSASLYDPCVRYKVSCNWVYLLMETFQQTVTQSSGWNCQTVKQSGGSNGVTDKKSNSMLIY